MNRIAEFEPLIRAMTMKYCPEEGLRDDCGQEARVTLLKVEDGYIDAYYRAVIRNSILGFLKDPKRGSWYHKRKNSGYHPFLALDELLDAGAIQVDEFGNVYGNERAVGAYVQSDHYWDND